MDNWRWFPLVTLAVLAAAGCNSGRHQVTGTVTYEDGAPVTAGTLVAEATIDGKVVAVQANIESDGSFRWGGGSPGDGALPGSYRVLITPPTLSDLEMSQGKRPAIDGKYGRFETSGLAFDVKAGTNEFPIKVTRPQ
jgi:hypothetical protein